MANLSRAYWAAMQKRVGCQRCVEGAAAGQRIDELLDEIAELQQEIILSPAETLKDAAVKLRRLSVYLEGREPVKLLAGALEAVERAAAGSQP